MKKIDLKIYDLKLSKFIYLKIKLCEKYLTEIIKK
jgi:hypothetical protein